MSCQLLFPRLKLNILNPKSVKLMYDFAHISHISQNMFVLVSFYHKKNLHITKNLHKMSKIFTKKQTQRHNVKHGHVHKHRIQNKLNINSI